LSSNLFKRARSALKSDPRPFDSEPDFNELEDALARLAARPGGADRLAEMLTRILPPFAEFRWGEDTTFRRHFNAWQRAGFNLTPNHHYFPIPDVVAIEPVLERESDLPGLDLRETEQLSLLESIFTRYRDELEELERTTIGDSSVRLVDSASYQHFDVHALHCMIRHHKPRRMIEIGSGYSTLVSAAACLRNRHDDEVSCEFKAIEPYPGDILKQDIPGLTGLIEEPLQSIGMDLFEGLRENDILFIDSTHVLSTGSDVALLYLEILPRLRPGVVVHVHDIFLPREYPRDWIEKEHIFWNEQYVLQAFLAHNADFEVLLAGHFLHLRHPEVLRTLVPGYCSEKHWPGSFWMRRGS
jgi:hypothetical protein